VTAFPRRPRLDAFLVAVSARSRRRCVRRRGCSCGLPLSRQVPDAAPAQRVAVGIGDRDRRILERLSIDMHEQRGFTLASVFLRFLALPLVRCSLVAPRNDHVVRDLKTADRAWLRGVPGGQLPFLISIPENSIRAFSSVRFLIFPFPLALRGSVG